MRLNGRNYYKGKELALAIIFTSIWDCPLHSHDFTELVVVLSGKGYHIVEDKRYPISTGDVFVVKTDTNHAYTDSERMGIVNVIFNPSELNIPTNDLYQIPAYYALFALEPSIRGAYGDFHHHLRLSEDELSRLTVILLQIARELEEQQAGYREMAIALFCQTMVFLSRRYELAAGPVSHKMLGLGKVLGYVERHLAEPHNLKQLAEIAEMSVRTLHRSFHQALGVSPIEYTMRKRLEKAAELLRCTDATITEIACKVGFEDSNYFSRCFRKRYGYSPRECRKLSLS